MGNLLQLTNVFGCSIQTLGIMNETKMEDLKMTGLEIALPASLIFLSFLLKLFIDRSTTAPVLIKSLYELPVDMTFLAMSLIIAYTIGSKESPSEGLFYFIIYTIGAIIIVFLWRRSIKCFEENKTVVSGVLAVINYSLSLFGIYISIKLVMRILK